MEARVGIGRSSREGTPAKWHVFLGIQAGFGLTRHYRFTTIPGFSLALSLAVSMRSNQVRSCTPVGHWSAHDDFIPRIHAEAVVLSESEIVSKTPSSWREVSKVWILFANCCGHQVYSHSHHHLCIDAILNSNAHQSHSSTFQPFF